MNAMDVDVGVEAVDQLHMTPQSTAKSPIDREHLSRYTLGDTALEHEILELFVGQLPKSMEALRHATSQKDWHAAAHSLKGSGRAVGAWRVAEIAAYAEKVHDGPSGPDGQRAIGLLEEATQEVTAYIADLAAA